MNAKMERQKLRNDVVKMARDEGKMDLSNPKIKEFINECMASDDPLKTMEAAIQALKNTTHVTERSADALPADGKPLGVALADSVPLGNGETLVTATLGSSLENGNHGTAIIGPDEPGWRTYFEGLPLRAADTIGYRAEHVQARLTPVQKENLSNLFLGLREDHVQLENGHHVDTHVDAVRWLLEQVPNLFIKREEQAAA